jgi:hypothetical protein
MTTVDVPAATAAETAPAAAPAPRGHRLTSWIPSWSLITTKQLEIRKRRGLMSVVFALTVGLPVLVLGIRLLFHAVDPGSYGPAGTPDVFEVLANVMGEFGFIVAAALGASAGTTDLSEGVFRHLVVTGRSRLSLYLARIPAGLSVVLPLVAVAFTMICLVTTYAGTPQPASVAVNGTAVPIGLSQSQFETWLLQDPADAGFVVQVVPGTGIAPTRRGIERNIGTIYGDYASLEVAVTNPTGNAMLKIGLWLELVVGMGFVVGLGLGSLTGQRTVSTVLMIVLQIIVTPILAATAIPYFLDGQRLVIGIALDQLRPAGLASGVAGRGGPGRALFGGRGVLGIPPMPTWAMISVIVGWVVVWTAVGAWRMMQRDA